MIDFLLLKIGCDWHSYVIPGVCHQGSKEIPAVIGDRSTKTAKGIEQRKVYNRFSLIPK